MFSKAVAPSCLGTQEWCRSMASRPRYRGFALTLHFVDLVIGFGSQQCRILTTQEKRITSETSQWQSHQQGHCHGVSTRQNIFSINVPTRGHKCLETTVEEVVNVRIPFCRTKNEYLNPLFEEFTTWPATFKVLLICYLTESPNNLKKLSAFPVSLYCGGK